MALMLSRGQTVGAFTIVELVGRGGEGDVYEARSAHHGRCALKQLKFSAKDPANRDVVERTFRLKRLIGVHSPYVCQILDVFIFDDLPYVAMEYVDGPTLEQILEKKTRLSLPEVIGIGRDVLSGLEWLHLNDIVHRDVKPANIVLATSPAGTHAKLIDLNICMARDLPRVTRRGMLLGSVEYAAPEILAGVESEIDGRADLYCLGSTMFHLLTGYLPFPEADFDLSPPFLGRLCAEERPSVRDHVPEIPKPVDDYIQRLMASRREDRPNTAAEAWKELQSAAADMDMSDIDLLCTHVDSASVIGAGHDLTRTGSVAPMHACAHCLSVETGPFTGATIAIPRSGVTLGRSKLNPDDAAISRFHFRITPRRRGIDVHDLGSLNGLIYRDRRVRRARLSDGDSFVAGETTVRLCTE